MEHVKILTDIPVANIQKYLAACEQDFETSQLYSSARNEKFTDEDLRKSVFRPITDEKLFDLVDSVISQLNDDDSFYKYTLRRNDVTHIKYEKGGFFKRHRDFLSTTSNLIEEFTLLLCVTPAAEAKGGVIGGDTTIHLFGGGKTFDTTTTGSGILFRKDLEHEGMELTNGEKHIITANIWATRKELSKQVLLVTFPTEGQDEKADSKMSMTEVANASTSYVLPVYILSGMLSAHVQWANRVAEQGGNDEPPVVTYECCDFDFDTFGVVEKVLNRSYVEEQAIYDAKECLDYFGPFKYENILVNLALEPAEESASGDHISKKARTHKSNDPQKSDDEPIDADLIICETEARMRAVANIAKALNEPYVPFKVLFVEGVLESQGDNGHDIVEIPMMAAACLIGDHDNVFFLRKIVTGEKSLTPVSFQDIHTTSNVFQLFPTSILDNLLPGNTVDFFDRKVNWGEGVDAADKRYRVQRQTRNNGYGLSLKVGLQPSAKSAVISSCFYTTYDMLDRNTKTVYLPGLDGHEGEEGGSGTSLFHRNEKGEVTFTEKEAERASDFIASFGLEERVKAALQQKRFVLPQKSNGVDAHFCNENVYGTVNILWVSGVIRMEDGGSENAKAAPEETTFDAWPSLEAKINTASVRNRMILNRVIWDL